MVHLLDCGAPWAMTAQSKEPLRMRRQIPRVACFYKGSRHHGTKTPSNHTEGLTSSDCTRLTGDTQAVGARHRSEYSAQWPSRDSDFYSRQPSSKYLANTGLQFLLF